MAKEMTVEVRQEFDAWVRNHEGWLGGTEFWSHQQQDWYQVPESLVRWKETAVRVVPTSKEQGFSPPRIAEGIKYDEGKLRYDLIPPYPLQEVARVFTIGAEKYEDWNWRKGMNWHRVLRALMSHVEAWRLGERLDKEDGQHHLASVVWCAMVLMEYEQYEIGTNDLWASQNTVRHPTDTRMGE